MLVVMDYSYSNATAVYAKHDIFEQFDKFSRAPLMVREVYDLRDCKDDQLVANITCRLPPRPAEGVSFADVAYRVTGFRVRCEPSRAPDFVDEKTFFFTYNGRQETPIPLVRHEAMKLIDLLKSEFGID